jgi:linearmycin/streptolysin S transport system permease protein
MRAIWAMVVKDMTLLARDRMAFFFTFGFPLIMAVFFGTIFAGGGKETPEMSIAVVDEDRTPGSRAFAKQLDDGPEFRADSMGLEDAREAVRMGKRVAFLVLPKGFADSRQRVFYGSGPEIQLGLDPSRKAEGGMIQGVLTKYLSQDLTRAFAQPESMRAMIPAQEADLDASPLDAKQKSTVKHFLGELDQFLGAQSADTTLRAGGGDGFQPVRFKQVDIARARRGPRNAYEVSFPQGVIWAILSTAFGFALSLVLERTRGTLVRLRVAPIARRRDILLGKALGCLLTILVVTSVLMLIGAVIFHVRPASLALLAAALLSAAVCFVGIMMIIASVSPSQRGVSGLGWAIMMLMSMTGGGMVPLFAMPAWMQSVGSVSPVRWAILALEGSIWRDFTPAQMLLPCGILVAVGLVGFGVGTRVFRWTEAAA